MSINLPSKRVAHSAQVAVRFSHSRPMPPLPQYSFYTHRRSYATARPPITSRGPADPLLEQHLKQKPSMQSNRLLKLGGLDKKSTIFSNIEELPDSSEDAASSPARYRASDGERNLETVGRVLDPVPSVRERWQRKMVIRSIRRRGRLNRTETLLRTERSSLSKSHFFKTSVKKLMMLARQIAGKDVDEAMLQMRFSKKKAARDVLEHLKHAKNEAIVRKGMGLGSDSPYISDARTKSPEDLEIGTTEEMRRKEKGTDKDDPLGEISKAENPKELYPTPATPMWRPKDRNPDLTKMYISQAWVGRGPYEREPEYRARGRVNILMRPFTSISVELKEEKTRARVAKEKTEKEERRRMKSVWTQLPDRKITTQRQYYCW